MIVSFIEVTPEGRIVGSGIAPFDQFHLQLCPREANRFIAVPDSTPVDGSFFYYVAPVGDALMPVLPDVRRRPTMPITITKIEIVADDADEVEVSNVPEGASVYLDEREIDGFDGDVLTFTSAMPATYQLRVECWPFLPFEVEIRAS